MQKYSFKDLNCLSISRKKNNFINLMNKYNNINKTSRAHSMFQRIYSKLIGIDKNNLVIIF